MNIERLGKTNRLQNGPGRQPHIAQKLNNTRLKMYLVDDWSSKLHTLQHGPPSRT
ncbi:hypothetical protein SESBI_26420 [Sesbania bispinosa]|nr:hypothetical protein SESBI_26420 [Sesbania bispinosa]